MGTGLIRAERSSIFVVVGRGPEIVGSRGEESFAKRRWFSRGFARRECVSLGKKYGNKIDFFL